MMFAISRTVTNCTSLSGGNLSAAVLKALELLGLCIALFAVNLAVGIAVVLTGRALSMPFLSA